MCEEVDNVELWEKINNCGYGREKKCGSFGVRDVEKLLILI